MKNILLSLVIALAPAAALADDATGSGDPIFRAMNDELGRTMDQLRLEKHEKPYYVSYRIDDKDDLHISSSFGAITQDDRNRNRDLTVDVHVGNQALDNGNSQGGGRFFLFRFNDNNLSLDDDYDAIRHKLWLETDDAYKRAIEGLESKKAELAQKNVKERPDDWTPEKPVVDVGDRVSLKADRAALKTMANELSQVFRDYPSIRQSNVQIEEWAENRYFVNSEGSKARQPETRCMIEATASAQAQDGTEVADHLVICVVPSEKQLPSVNELQSKVRALAEQLTNAVSAKDAELYQGPVLFEGEAAAEFLKASIAPHLGIVRGSDTDDSEAGNPLQARIGRRILPTWFNVIDDPHMKDQSGTPMAGNYTLDDQGVKAQRVQLVEKGILKTLLATRVPITKVKASNGHAIGGQAEPSNLIFETESKLDPQQLKAKLIQMGRDEGLPYVLVARKLADMGDGGTGMGTISAMRFIFDTGGGTSDKVDLPMPISISKVFLNDGHEEPLRNLEFTGASLRVLRDIVANGNDSRTYPFHDWRTITSITTPSLLVSELELQKSHQSADKPPALPHPYFEEHPIVLRKK